ncbi:MAG TPA: DUF302 domain-containing protein [Burkholderiales bacterium]|nr:DUF302 domain-containing protein [Burkholderiales bacterium]
MSACGFGKQVQLSFDQAVQRVTQALAAEGFGVLSEIDVAGTLKKKLDKTIPPYKILGACNPGYAAKAIEAEPQIGLLLPCNVVVRQDADGAVHVEFMDPHAVLDLVQKPEVEALGNEVRAKLERAMASV